MTYSCPRCQSENTQKLSVLVGGGSSSFVAQSVGIGAGGRIGVGVANTSGASQTALAKKYAAPAKVNPFAGLLFVIVGGVLGIFYGWEWFYGGCALFGFIFVAALYHNTLKFPALYKHWDTQFLCMRCENLYIPGPPAD